MSETPRAQGTAARTDTRLSALDGLRGVAAAIVVLHHTLLLTPAISNVYMQGPFPERGLPPENLSGNNYHQYEVVRPIPVWEGRIAEAMGQPGGGTQYFMPHPVVDLVNAGYLREVAP